MGERERGRFFSPPKITGTNNIDNRVCHSKVISNPGVNERHETENNKAVITKNLNTPTMSYLINYYEEL